MRKYTRIGTFLLALVMCLTMLTAQAESELPEEVADLFTVKAWAHYAIANQPDMPENKAFAVMQEKSGYEAALLVMRNTKSETNVLVLAEKSSAQADWKITMRMISLQDSFSHIHVDGHGILGVIFPGTSRCHLERLIAIRIYLCNVINHGLTQLLEALILYVHHRTDPGNAEDSLQVRYHFIIVEFRLCIHEDTSLRLVHQEFSFTFFQCVFDLAYQSILEQITVFSLNADLGIFYQK